MLDFNATCSSLDQLLEHHNQTESNRLINGYLGLIKNLVQYLGSNMKEACISSNTTSPSTNPAKSPDANEQHLPISIRQIIEVKHTQSMPFPNAIVSSSSVLISSAISVYNIPIIMLYLVR